MELILMMPELRILADRQHIKTFLAQVSDDLLFDVVIGVQPPLLATLSYPHPTVFVV
jgi:hypothetical protein